MTRATVEDSTAGLGQTLCTGRPLVGGLILPCRRGTVHEFAPPGGISGPECLRHRGRCRSVSLAFGVGQLPVIRHALDGAQCGEQRGADHKNSEMKSM